MDTLVRRARPADSAAIARLHRETIPRGLLSQLGDGVVRAFYRAVTECPVSFCFVAEQDGRIQGFGAGVTHWSVLFRRVVRRTAWPLLRAFPTLLVSGKLRWVWQTSRYTQSGMEGVDAEFLAFGVREEARGRLWSGAAIVDAVIHEFRQRGIKKIRGVVAADNERAMRFFEAVGFRFVSEIEIHPGDPSRTHVMDLTPIAKVVSAE